jgi:hypothetical protein
VTCRWKDGRIGVLRVDRPYSKFGAVAFRAKNQVDVLPDIKMDYLPLVRQDRSIRDNRKASRDEHRNSGNIPNDGCRSEEQGTGWQARRDVDVRLYPE